MERRTVEQNTVSKLSLLTSPQGGWYRVGDYPALTFRYRQGRTPLVSQDVQTDASVAVDVGVVDAGGEVDLWWLEGVVCGEVDGEEEDAARVWRVAWSHDGGLPVKLCAHSMSV